MRYWSRITKILALSILLANFLILVQSASSNNIPSASALTPAQCKNRYDGKGQGGGISDGDKLTDKEYETFRKSDCFKGGDAPCSLNGASRGFVISCKTAADDKDEDEGESTEIGADYDSDDCSSGINGDCKLVDLIVTITNVLSGLAATVIVAMIVLGGIQYSMAGSEAAKIQAAKQKIINALLALLLLIFGFSIIQWLVPGGLI